MSFLTSATKIHFLVIGNPESRRGQLFQKAIKGSETLSAQLVSYADLLTNQVDLGEFDIANTIFRFEAPERSFEVDRGFIAAGAELNLSGQHQQITAIEAAKLPADLGRIWYQRQWYLGWRHSLQTWTANLQGRILNHPEDIALMFDKVQCQQVLAMAKIPVPPRLLPGQSVPNYDQLCKLMDEQGIHRVFVKLAHGSSASGVVAYERHSGIERAITTVERVVEQGELRFYNSRQIRQYRKSTEIAEIINFLAAELVQVETWLPKARIAGREFDVRIVVIGGRACHAVIRLGNSPLTNLHLGNDRREITDLPPGLTPAVWQTMLTTCERAAACFPRSLYCGVDLLIAPNLQDHYILEMNAFGDLLRGVTYAGLDYDSAEDTLALLTHFLADPNVTKVTSLIIGVWSYESESNQPLVELLISSSHQLPNLSALFLGDIIEEEAQISWIVQSNLSALLQAYPQLEYLQIKGNDGLSFGEMKLDHLKTLIIETGGLSPIVAKEVFQAQLPALEHLELWLGTPDYGGDITPEDLTPVLDGSLFPKLSYLGLRDSEIADQIAVAVANAPIVQRLKTLDLSLGNVGDVGATALLASPLINQLEKLDLHHHYISEELTNKLTKLNIVVDVTDHQEADVYDGAEYRYIAVSE